MLPEVWRVLGQLLHVRQDLLARVLREVAQRRDVALGNVTEREADAPHAEVGQRLRTQLHTWRKDVVADPFLDSMFVAEFSATYRKAGFSMTAPEQKPVISYITLFNKSG